MRVNFEVLKHILESRSARCCYTCFPLRKTCSPFLVTRNSSLAEKRKCLSLAVTKIIPSFKQFSNVIGSSGYVFLLCETTYRGLHCAFLLWYMLIFCWTTMIDFTRLSLRIYDFICSLLGHVITSTNQLQQNWLERTISFILGRLVIGLFGIWNLKIV